jgi:hypothetical protein
MGDFYDSNVMAEARKHGSNRAMLAQSTAYTMGKGGSPEDYERVLAAVAGSRWTDNEKKGIYGGVAAAVKGQALQYKAFEPGDYLKDFKKASGAELPPAPKFNLRKLVAQYSGTGSYMMSRMDSAAWKTWDKEVAKLTEVQAQMDTTAKKDMDDMLMRIGRRAYQYIDGVKRGGNQIPEEDEDGNVRYINLGSDVSPDAAKAAEKFYRTLYGQMKTKYGESELQKLLPKPPEGE